MNLISLSETKWLLSKWGIFIRDSHKHFSCYVCYHYLTSHFSLFYSSVLGWRTHVTPHSSSSCRQYTRVYPKVSGLNRWRDIRLLLVFLVEKQHKSLWRQNSLDWLIK